MNIMINRLGAAQSLKRAPARRLRLNFMALILSLSVVVMVGSMFFVLLMCFRYALVHSF